MCQNCGRTGTIYLVRTAANGSRLYRCCMCGHEFTVRR